jgi:hypothetical protein
VVAQPVHRQAALDFFISIFTLSAFGVRVMRRVAEVIEGLGEGSGQPDAFVKLADGRQPRVAGELPGRGLDDELTSRVPKKSRTWGQAGGILIGCLCPSDQGLLARQV